MNLSISFGADPEMIVEPHEVDLEKYNLNVRNSKVAYDGVFLEIQSCPTTCREQFMDRFSSALLYLTQNNHKIIIKPMNEIDVSKFTKEQLRLGCDPSINAYTKHKIPKWAEKYPFRAAGGHLHFGIECEAEANFRNLRFPETVYIRLNTLAENNVEPGMYNRNEADDLGLIANMDYPLRFLMEHPVERIFVKKYNTTILENINSVVKMLDLSIGLACVWLTKYQSEAESERRMIYGKAGEYRIQPHGIEYRTPSNFWLWNLPVASFLLLMSKKALKGIDDSSIDVVKVQEITKVNGVDEIINFCNIEEAKKLLFSTTLKMLDIKLRNEEIDYLEEFSKVGFQLIKRYHNGYSINGLRTASKYIKGSGFSSITKIRGIVNE